jgi:hypothetical protein
MRQHVYCLGYISFVLVMCSLSGLFLYRTRLGKEHITNIKETQPKQYVSKKQIWSPLFNGLNNILNNIYFDLFKITDMLLHNYVQHEKCLPSVTKNYELKMVD